MIIAEVPFVVMTKTRSRHADAVAELIEKRRLKDRTQPIIYTISDFRKKFSYRPTFQYYLISKFRQAGILKPKIVFDYGKGKVFITKNDD